MANTKTVSLFAFCLLAAVAVAAPAQAPAPALRTPDVIYVPTPQNVVEAMLKMANVKQGDIVFDLGSGDGRIPITAVQKFGATRATFLPQVWDNLADPLDFLCELRRKAGLPARFWHEGVKLSRYTVEKHK